MKHNPILIADMYEEDVYHRIESDFWDSPISASAKGLYLVIRSLGDSHPNSIDDLLQMGCGSIVEITTGLAELDRAGFDTSNLVRA